MHERKCKELIIESMSEHSALTVHVIMSSPRSPPPPPRPLGATVGAETQPHTKRMHFNCHVLILVNLGTPIDFRLFILIVYWFTCLINY